VSYQAKVYYHHTDCGGVVYYASYLEFLEEARTAYLAGLGVNIPELVVQGRFFVVSRQEVDYKRPARYGDILSIETAVADITGVRIELRHRVTDQNKEEIITARTVLAHLSSDFRPVPIPAELREKMSGSHDTE
jgi:acyl-CoA thioester hydrolase